MENSMDELTNDIQEENEEQSNKQTFTMTATITTTDDDDDQTGCGLGCFQPKALRPCASMPCFTGFYSINALMTATLSFYITSQVTTLERHFGFSSSQSGIILAANDIGFLLVVLFVSFIAKKVHIPRALGLFTILFGLSGIVCALPYFLLGAPSAPPSLSAAGRHGNLSGLMSARSSRILRGQICDGINHSSSICDARPEGSQMAQDDEDLGIRARSQAGTALAIIVIGMVFQGIGKAPRSAFTTTYVDDNVPKAKTGFYMGIIIAVGIVGPALGFALGGVFSRIYVTLEDTEMHFRHPKWIGAWWLGFIVFGAGGCLFSVPVLCFPRRMKSRPPPPTTPRPQTETVGVLRSVYRFLKGFPMAIIRLLRNPVYMCTVLSKCCLLFAGAGGQSFGPKYIETQFDFPAWKANMAVAGVLLGIGCVGTFVGGYLTKRLKMGPMASLQFVTVMFAMSVFFSGLLMAFKCDQPPHYNSPGPLSAQDTSLSACLEGCACDDGDYFPVCGQDGRTFFSPCHAGCQGSGNGVYMNCTCIPEGAAIAGTCDYSCAMFYPYIGCICVSVLLSTFAIVPELIIYIRAVKDHDKPLALGFSAFMTSILGWMLGPIAFGRIIDSACIQWETNSCSGGGACRLYDNNSLRWKFQGYQTIIRIVGLVFIIVALVTARITKWFEKNKVMGQGDSLMTEMDVPK